jgi:hypothetical protein
MKHRLAIVVAGTMMLAASLVWAQQPPMRNVSPGHHPNIAAAQRLSQQAFEKLIAAQKANEWDMGGHAEKAKELLEQANAQMKLAAEAANRR